MQQFNSARGKETIREAELDDEIDDFIEEAQAGTDGLEVEISVDYFDY